MLPPRVQAEALRVGSELRDAYGPDLQAAAEKMRERKKELVPYLTKRAMIARDCADLARALDALDDASPGQEPGATAD